MVCFSFDFEAATHSLYMFIQMIYVGIVGPVMAMATLEWFLWISAFVYCLWKVYVKAEHWSIKVLAVIMVVAFTALRYMKPLLHYLSAGR